MSTPPPATPERRAAPRYQPAFGTVCRFAAPAGQSPATVGLVWNISETGLSLLTHRPPERGTVVAADLAAEDGGPGLAVSFRVVHVRPLETGDFFLGARFERPLGAEEMRPFLADPMPRATRPGG